MGKKSGRTLVDERRLELAEELLGHRFDDRALLLRALTHRSFVHEAKDLSAKDHNERLEFLGDAVLGLLAAESLLAQSPSADEGELSRRRAAWVSEPALALRAKALGVGELVRLGKGQAQEGGTQLPSILSDALEALLGAAYLDGGLLVARAVTARLLGEVPHKDVVPDVDPKTVLQELLQGTRGRPPTYLTSREGGEEHSPRFVAEARFDHEVLGAGAGANKKEATRAAAKDALARLLDLP
jgi:ribonuclease III